MAFAAVVLAVLAGLGGLWWVAGRRQQPAARAGGRATAAVAPMTRTQVESQLTPVAAVHHPAGSAEAAPAAGRAPAPTVRLPDDCGPSPDVALALTAVTDGVPRPRGVMLQLLQAGDEPAEVARAVASDPPTAALLLRTVNSAQLGLAQEISSVQHAITYLGARLVRDIATRHAVLVRVDGQDATAERVYQSLWRVSYLASGIIHALAQRMGWPSPSVLSTQALLFRLGDIALISHRPELAFLYDADPDLSDLVDQTQQALGFNAAMVGAHLAGVWGLPRALGDVLRHSLAPLVGAPLGDDLRLGVTAGYFASRLAQALSRQADFDLPSALDDLMGHAEAHYLPQYLADIGLPDPRAALGESTVERRLASLIARR